MRDTTAVRQRIGYVFGGDRGLYDRVSAMDNLRYFAELYGVEAEGEQKRRIGALLELVGLTGRENEKVRGLQPRHAAAPAHRARPAARPRR